METGQAAPEGVQLANEIADLAKVRLPSELALARLESRARAIRGVDPFFAYMALGMLAAIVKNEPEMRAHFDRALKLRPQDYLVRANYAASLQMMNLFSEARDMGLEAYQRDPANPRALEEAIRYCVATCSFSRTTGLLAKWEKLQPGREHSQVSKIQQAAKYLVANRLEEEQVEALIRAGLETLRESHVFAAAFNVEVMSGEDSTWLTYDLILNEPVERVVDLNTMLIHRLIGEERLREVEQRVLVMYLVGDGE